MRLKGYKILLQVELTDNGLGKKDAAQARERRVRIWAGYSTAVV
jgi:hypothetical protein